jgi:hypothetical protein
VTEEIVDYNYPNLSMNNPDGEHINFRENWLNKDNSLSSVPENYSAYQVISPNSSA